MLRLVNPNIQFPELYPKVERKLPTVADKGYDKVGGFLLREKIDLMPQPGIQENLCACDSNLIFLCGAATMGKAQPYDAKVLTPEGFVEMGSLHLGSFITGADGQPQKVLGVFEQGEKDVYGVFFDDGSYTECCKEHLWKVASRTTRSNQLYGDYYVTDFENVMKLLDDKFAVCVPYCGKAVFEKKELPIAPYTLGAILGDGHFPKRGNPQITCYDIEILDRIRQDGYKVGGIPSHEHGFIISGNDINSHVKSLELHDKKSWSKFIPNIYKTASVHDRMEILRGLMDTDGCVDKQGRLYFATASKQLALDFQWIVRSLGGRCSITENHPKYKWNGEIKQGRISYCLWFGFDDDNDVVTIKRKKERTKPHSRKRRKAIVGYKYIGKKKCRCILVSNPDHLYVTDDFIVTHNTYGMFLKALTGIDRVGFTARMVSTRLQDSKKGSSIFRDAVEVCGNFGGCEYNSSDYPTFMWKETNSNLQLIHLNYNVNNPSEWEEFKEYIKKQQSSMFLLDEATDMQEKAVMYMFSRNRDSSGADLQMILSFNPEHTHFTTTVLRDAGYLTDDWFFRPEMNGVTRYFYVAGDTFHNLIWGETPEEVAKAANIKLTKDEIDAGITIKQIVKSFTAFTGTASDNRKLVAATKGQSIGNLHAVGATQREILKGGYFGPVDDETNDITRQMLHNLWENPLADDENMYATMDISSGNDESDKSPMIIWRGLQIIAIKIFRGSLSELPNWISHTLRDYGVPIANFAFDANGIGYFLKSFTSGMPILSQKRPMQEFDEYGNPVQMDMFFNLRSQLLGKTKVMFERGDISCAVDKNTLIPYGKKGETRQLFDILCDEIQIFVYETYNGRIKYKLKDEYRKKYHHSPDLMDTIVLRAVFELDARPKKKPSPPIADDAYNGLYRSFTPNARSMWV